jgi:Universal stress protein family
MYASAQLTGTRGAARVQRRSRTPAASYAYEQILLAYKRSPGARAALERVAAVTTSETTVTVITVIPFESIGAGPDPIKPELREWQWQSLTEAAALLEQRGIKSFSEAAAGNPAQGFSSETVDMVLPVCCPKITFTSPSWQRNMSFCRANEETGATGLDPATSGVTDHFSGRDVHDDAHASALLMRLRRPPSTPHG